jgi:hypothetical protein
VRSLELHITLKRARNKWPQRWRRQSNADGQSPGARESQITSSSVTILNPFVYLSFSGANGAALNNLTIFYAVPIGIGPSKILDGGGSEPIPRINLILHPRKMDWPDRSSLNFDLKKI